MTSGWEGPRSDTLHWAAFFFLLVFAVLASLFPLFFSSCFLISFHPLCLILPSTRFLSFFSSPYIFPSLSLSISLFNFPCFVSCCRTSHVILLSFPLSSFYFSCFPFSSSVSSSWLYHASSLVIVSYSTFTCFPFFLLVSSLLLFFHPSHQFPVSSWLLFHLFLYAFLYFSHFTLFPFLCFLWHLSSCFILSLFLVSFPLFLFFTVPFPFFAPSSFFPSLHRFLSCLLAFIWSVHFLTPCLLLLLFSGVIKQTIFASLR